MMPMLPPHVRNRFDYPPHCGEETTLSVWGWRCAVCGAYLPFRQELPPVRQDSGTEKRGAKKKAMQ